MWTFHQIACFLYAWTTYFSITGFKFLFTRVPVTELPLIALHTLWYSTLWCSSRKFLDQWLPWDSLGPFQGICKVKTCSTMILRYRLLFSLSYSYEYIAVFPRSYMAYGNTEAGRHRSVPWSQTSRHSNKKNATLLKICFKKSFP